jgi:WD40 repeat protein
LDCGGNVLAYTSDAARLAIGYTNGSVTLLDENFSVIAIRKDRAKPISEIKFSPDNTICAVGAHDSIILTYDVKNNLKPMKKIQGHHSTVLHFDFS